MSMLELFRSDVYTDGRTKQAFKDSTDINKLLAKAAKGDAIDHLTKYGAAYGDFTDMPDLLEAQRRLGEGQDIFMQLPGEVRREFNQSAAAFFEYVNDPEHANDLARLIPGLVERGTQLVSPDRTMTMAPIEPPVSEVVPPVVEPPVELPSS